MQNLTPLMRQRQEHVQGLEADRWYDEEIHRNHVLNVIFKEGQVRALGLIALIWSGAIRSA